MRKFTLLLSFLVCVLFSNLLTNPSFETWADSKPTGWTFSTSGGTVSQSTDVASGTGNSVQIAATATFYATQIVVGPFEAGKEYKVSLKYKVTAGDLTDARIWSNWITSDASATTVLYKTMSLADSLGLKGPGGNNQPTSAGDGTNGYFASNNNTWSNYSFKFIAPSDAKQFSFQVRTYKGATVIWDDFYFGLSTTTNTTNPSANNTIAYVSGKDLVITNVANQSAVEIFSALGSKVKSATIENSKVDISDLSKGLYIVRSGKLTQKFVIK
jgi:hypothetical protein